MNPRLAICIVVVLLLGVGCGDDVPPKPKNTAPTASFTVTPSSGTTETDFSFDASGCSDVEDAASVLEGHWDWEGDGIWDTAYSTTKAETYQYGSAGTKTIRLEVKDTEGLTAQQSDEEFNAALDSAITAIAKASNS